MSKKAFTTQQQYLFAIGAVVIAGTILRFVALQDGLWMDEIWSWLLAQQAESALDVFTKLKYDNNHPLNTLLIYLTGNDVHWIVYRLPVFAFGIVSVVLASFISWQRSPREGLITAVLMSSSMLMVQHTTEARGYAYLLCFGLIAYWLTITYFQQQTWSTRLLFALICLLGMSTHLTFVILCTCLGVWALALQPLNRAHLGRVVTWFALPALLVIGVYYLSYHDLLVWRDVRYYQPLEIPIVTMAGIFGAGEHNPQLIAAAVITTLVILYQTLVTLWRTDRAHFAFAVTMLGWTMVLMVLADRNSAWATRFVLLPIVFFYLACSALLAEHSRRSPVAQWTTVGLLTLFVACNSVRAGELITRQRSRYPELFSYIVTHTEGNQTSLGSNFVHAAYALRFHERSLPATPQIRYSRFGYEDTPLPPMDLAYPAIDDTVAPEWYIQSIYNPRMAHAQPTLTVNRQHYVLERASEEWFFGNTAHIYRRQATEL